MTYGPGAPLSGSLLYEASDHAFSYIKFDAFDLAERVGQRGVTSLVADTLQLEVGVGTGIILYAWGYLPKTSWIESEVEIPDIIDGVVRVNDLGDLDPGVSLSILRGAEWEAEFDRSIGVLKVTSSGVPGSPYDVPKVVRIADKVAVGISADRIVSIWLWPEFRGEV